MCEIIFFKNLKKVLCRCVLLQMKENESFKLIVKVIFKGLFPRETKGDIAHLRFVDTLFEMSREKLA